MIGSKISFVHLFSGTQSPSISIATLCQVLGMGLGKSKDKVDATLSS